MDIRFYSNRRRSNIPPSPGALYFFFGMFSLFGLVFAAVGVNTWMKAEASKRWLPADGQVVSSDVDRHHSSKGGTTYRASVAYDYEYEGRTYKGSRIGIMSSRSSDRGAAQRAADRYAAGTKVQVYVNPADPYEAVLEPGGGGFAVMFILFGGVFAAIGVAGFLNAPKLIAQSGANAPDLGQFKEPASPAPGIPGGQDDPLGRL